MVIGNCHSEPHEESVTGWKLRYDYVTGFFLLSVVRVTKSPKLSFKHY